MRTSVHGGALGLITLALSIIFYKCIHNDSEAGHETAVQQEQAVQLESGRTLPNQSVPVELETVGMEIGMEMQLE